MHSRPCRYRHQAPRYLLRSDAKSAALCHKSVPLRLPADALNTFALVPVHSGPVRVHYFHTVEFVFCGSRSDL